MHLTQTEQSSRSVKGNDHINIASMFFFFALLVSELTLLSPPTLAHLPLMKPSQRAFQMIVH